MWFGQRLALLPDPNPVQSRLACNTRDDSSENAASSLTNDPYAPFDKIKQFLVVLESDVIP